MKLDVKVSKSGIVCFAMCWFLYTPRTVQFRCAKLMDCTGYISCASLYIYIEQCSNFIYFQNCMYLRSIFLQLKLEQNSNIFSHRVPSWSLDGKICVIIYCIIIRGDKNTHFIEMSCSEKLRKTTLYTAMSRCFTKNILKRLYNSAIGFNVFFFSPRSGW